MTKDGYNTSTANISIAMATHNGERYVVDQLLSILQQTLLPREIVIVDDASTDHTREKIASVIKTSPIPVTLIVITQNQGSTKSFDQAIRTCKGDWIALADQDDVWHPQKLEKLMHCCIEHSWDVIFSDADLVDQNLKPLNIKLFANSRLTRSMRNKFLQGEGLSPLLRYNVATGATMMFRSKWSELIVPIPTNWHHDYWIALLISCVAKVGLSNDALILYRQHSSNQIGAKTLSAEINRSRTKTSDQYLEESALFGMAREKLAGSGFGQIPAMIELHNKEDFLRSRYNLLRQNSRGMDYLANNIWKGTYFRYGQGWRTLLKDLFVSLKSNKLVKKDAEK